MKKQYANSRSYNMSKIKNKNTKPELLVRKWLWKKGFRYRLHYKKLPGKPDLVFIRLRKVIFINGCFWHKHNCNYFSWPKTNTNFWKEKILTNHMRDCENIAKLENEGWQIMTIWGCELKPKVIESTLIKVYKFLLS